ncbi:mucolipin-3-like [Malaya genurostris]|uniref:mucolipin-3-like n=1 Tax=Malaya genurostris TaxID=325434 RepID=UPI0026F3C784|nr:mucolipin-3-like [Malaya genurostris]
MVASVVRASSCSSPASDLEMSSYSSASSSSSSTASPSTSKQPRNKAGTRSSAAETDNEKLLLVKQKIDTTVNQQHPQRTAEPRQENQASVSQSGEENHTMNINSSEDGFVESPVLGNSQTSLSEERLRRKLQFFFMNPIEKWQAKRRFPYKFVVQVIKIILVTLQLCLFAHSRYMHVNYTWDNTITFSHLFLRGWDITMEVSTYPPETGPLSVYMVDDFFKTIDYAIDGYANLSEAIGPYSYPNEDNTMPPMQLCLYRFKDGTIFGFNESYVFNPEIDTLCLDLDGNVTTIGSRKFIRQKDIHINFSALVKAELKFAIKTVNFKAAGPITAPDCYRFDILILFNNQDHDGQMTLRLEAEPTRLVCHGDVEFIKTSEIEEALRSTLNILVIVICLVSFALCARAIYRAQLLRIITCDYFKQTYGRDLTAEGKWEFVNMWYIMIVFNDFLLVIGSALKEEIERKHFIADDWNVCSLLLGIGNLLVWFGVLRYLGFFKTYNVVILTLQKAAPKILRFLLCALLIYAGFIFCGWLVLGPYHIKFRSLSTTSECLFALINGDDMFATFTIMPEKSLMLWWFCRLYLYSFTSLYIYVVLSLFISVIMDAYDTIKKYYKDGFPLSDLRQFVGPYHPNDFSAGVFRDDDDLDYETISVLGAIRRIVCFWRPDPLPRGPTGYTSLSPKPS